MSEKPTYEELVQRIQALEEKLSELKDAGSKLQDRENRLREAQQLVHMGHWSWDVSSGKVEWSKEVFEIFRLDPKEFTPQIDSILQLSPWPEDHVRDKELIRKAIESHEVGSYEQKFLRPDGSIGHYFSSFMGVYDDNGNLTEIKGVVQDITERKKDEEERNKLQTQLSNALEIANLGPWEYDIAKDLFTFNDYFYKLFCTTSKEIGGYTMSSAEYSQRFLHPEDRDCVGEGIRRAIETPDPDFSNQLEHRIIYADGQVGYASVHHFAVKDESGKTVKTYGVTQDITARKNMERQLQLSQKMESVGRLAGGIAHDFNNMLSIILGNIEMLQEDITPDSPLLRRIHEVKKAAQRSADLTRQLLAFARKQTILPKILNPNSAIDGMLNMLKRLIGEDIDLLWNPNEQLWSVKMDPSQVDQILANLCINARDAIKGVGKVTIETDNICFDNNYCREHRGFSPGEFVLIGVSDNGGGMDKETIDRVFEPFFTTKKNGKGTGLGLATVYGIIKQNNGFINVYSEPGQGTTFKIYIPRHEGCQPQEPVIATENLQKGSETILLVEDEQAILQMTKTMLERLGYMVLPANTPEDAIRICNRYNKKIDLLITDVVMPSMNGRELAHTILKGSPNIKCLYMSGYTSNVIAHRGILDEGLNFINKPFSKQALSVKLRNILDEKSN
ncbi:ATP-binding protein [uncultured Desulfobacter sp.]|uniref:hybrid sensor histidine kinase/response regulator n=1 Tax=uncultured Desulfobacter sp. TaxID=240139 RepID=UPI002AAB5514|nr:ATP-binding protein [uncultured Desulfobacter sp.]